MPRHLRKRFDRDVEAVKAILREWDPIGVFPNCEDGPRDEYDSYAPQVLSLLYAAKPAEDIANHLDHLRAHDMRMPKQHEQDFAIATRLVSLRLSTPE
jgi:hypothetical protein